MATRMDGNDRDTVAAVARGGWGWVMAIGILTLIAGIAMVSAPVLTTIAAAVIAGWVLLFLGVAGIVIGVRSRRSTGRVWEIVTGLFSMVAGLYMLVYPVSGAITLTLAVAIWLAVRGVMWLAAGWRDTAGGYRGLKVLNGIVDLLLAALLFAGFPFPAIGFVGIAIGVSLLFGGVSTIMAAFALRKLA